MNSDDNGSESKPNETPVARSNTALVKRSSVPAVKEYGEYKKYLRRDFFHSCAYCTMAEFEAHAIRFTIDHYEPQHAREDLINEYSNLMWSCDTCNTRKGERYPPEEARAEGFRFFRPDVDIRDEHFERSDLLLKSKSNVGSFTIDAVDLNRQMLIRLRDIRGRAHECGRFVEEGVMALRNFPIDRLPAHIKARAALAIHRATAVAKKIGGEMDDLLRAYAKSELVDDDQEDPVQAAERAAALKKLEAMFPGGWRASRERRARNRNQKHRK